MVVGQNLCPFARREVQKGRVHYFVSRSGDEEQLLMDLHDQLLRLQGDAAIETLLLVHPWVLGDFAEYNRFLDVVDALLEHMGLLGAFQIASFHPRYRFAGSAAEDLGNFTNRSPYPLLHVLREDSLERAIAAHGDVSAIPLRNVAHLRALGRTGVYELLQRCAHGEEGS